MVIYSCAGGLCVTTIDYQNSLVFFRTCVYVCQFSIYSLSIINKINICFRFNNNDNDGWSQKVRKSKIINTGKLFENKLSCYTKFLIFFLVKIFVFPFPRFFFFLSLYQFKLSLRWLFVTHWILKRMRERGMFFFLDFISSSSSLLLIINIIMNFFSFFSKKKLDDTHNTNEKNF